MRCIICNELLTDFEATRKDPYTRGLLIRATYVGKAHA
jgi:hypothetical protein